MNNNNNKVISFNFSLSLSLRYKEERISNTGEMKKGVYSSIRRRSQNKGEISISQREECRSWYRLNDHQIDFINQELKVVTD